MVHSLAISRAAFHAAFKSGDLSTISAYFSQPSVRLEIAETETLIAADGSSSLIINRPHGVQVYPWYYDQHRRVLLFQDAVNNGHLDIVQWFFSPPRLLSMRAALTRVFQTVAYIATNSSQLEILEWLLSDHVSGVLLTQNELQHLLNDLLLARPRVDTTLQLLLAHGADINDHVLSTWTNLRSNSGIDGQAFQTAEHEGAFLVGADLLLFAANTGDLSMIRQLLQLGVDFGCSQWITWDTHPLHQATTARHVETVRILVEEGFADVDCRDDEGQTPLLVACSATALSYVDDDDVPLQIAQIYLQAGADTAITDARGRSPVRWAIANKQLLPVLKLLLDHGADPNEYNAVDGPLLAYLFRGETEFEEVEPTLTLLLEAGADISVCGEDGSSVLDQLRGTVNGSEYIEAHPEFFGVETGAWR